jgi:hypothetical protein
VDLKHRGTSHTYSVLKLVQNCSDANM